jgi:hypothetical protein
MNEPPPTDNPVTAQPIASEKPEPETPDPGRSMWKIWSLVGLFAAFLAFVIFFVYPNQEGMISSTQLQIGALQNVSAAYAETLPIPDVGINNQGRSMFIAFVMLAHVLFAHLHLGDRGDCILADFKSHRTPRGRC